MHVDNWHPAFEYDLDYAGDSFSLVIECLIKVELQDDRERRQGLVLEWKFITPEG